jgi:hypothetical protein
VAAPAVPRNRYEGEVADNRLTFEGPARYQYELDDEGKIKVNPDGTISVAWWLRDENGEWKPWMDNTFTNVKSRWTRPTVTSDGRGLR